MSAVDGMLDKIWERKVRNGEPCAQGMCGRTEGVKRPDGTMGACPTCEVQRERWVTFWSAWTATNER